MLRQNYKLVSPHCTHGKACSAAPRFDGPTASGSGHAVHEASWGCLPQCDVPYTLVHRGRFGAPWLASHLGVFPALQTHLENSQHVHRHCWSTLSLNKTAKHQCVHIQEIDHCSWSVLLLVLHQCFKKLCDKEVLLATSTAMTIFKYSTGAEVEKRPRRYLTCPSLLTYSKQVL